jgi:hypothetical protein
LDRKLFALAMQGAKLVSGYVALVPERQVQYKMEDPNAEPDEPLLGRWRLAGAGWLRHRGSWNRLADPAPRAWLVTQARVSDDPQADLADIDPLATALVSEAVAGLSGDRAGAAEVEVDRPGRITIVTETASRQLLVVDENYHRGWQVEVDGGPGNVVRSFGDYLGCVVEPGRHTVRFQFAPSSFRYGAWLTLAGLAGMAASFVVSRRDRKADSPADGKTAE